VQALEAGFYGNAVHRNPDESISACDLELILDANRGVDSEEFEIPSASFVASRT